MSDGTPFHFSCVPNCGKCCDRTPDMGIVEGLSLFREFILDLSLRGFPAGSPADEGARDRAAALRDLGVLYADAPNGRRLFLTIGTRGLAPDSLQRCPQRDQAGQCRIYQSRPQNCRILPLAHGSPEGKRVALSRKRVSDWQAAGYSCDTSPDAEPLHDGAALAPNWQAILDATRAQQHAEVAAGSRMIEKLLAILGKQAPACLADLDRRAADNRWLAVNVLAFLDFFRTEFPDAGLPDDRSFAAAQLPQIEAMIADTLARRAPEDRAVTERLRKLKVDYQMVLAAA